MIQVVTYDEFTAAVSGLREEINRLRALLPATAPESQLLTASEAAAYLRITPEGLRRARREGRVKGVKANEKEYAYYLSDLDAYLRRYNKKP